MKTIRIRCWFVQMEKLFGDLKNDFGGERNLVIISETDLQGKIISANDPFCSISGYCRNELIGRPHNIIRHPMMPKELFRQLWLTIRKGDVFRAVIKNQAKNGNHYWVNATIMPVFQRNQIVRYVGGRHLITDENLAEDLFNKQMSTFKTRS